MDMHPCDSPRAMGRVKHDQAGRHSCPGKQSLAVHQKKEVWNASHFHRMVDTQKRLFSAARNTGYYVGRAPLLQQPECINLTAFPACEAAIASKNSRSHLIATAGSFLIGNYPPYIAATKRLADRAMLGIERSNKPRATYKHLIERAQNMS